MNENKRGAYDNNVNIFTMQWFLTMVPSNPFGLGVRKKSCEILVQAAQT